MGELNIQVDYREPQEIIDLLSIYANVEVKPLEVGDYVSGDVGVERKSGDFLDFPDVITKSMRLLDTYPRAYLIVDTSIKDLIKEIHRHRGKRTLKEQQLYGCISSLCIRGTPPIFTSSPVNCVEVLWRLFRKADDGKDRSFIPHPKPRRTLDDLRMGVIESFLPGIGDIIAQGVLVEFGSIRGVLEADIKDLMKVKGISEKRAHKIFEVIHGTWRESNVGPES